MNLRIVLLVLTLIAPICGVQAQSMNMRGTLLSISCTVNNDKPLDISFGDAIGINSVDGENHRQELPLEFTCSQPPGDILHLMFVGNQTDFDPAAITTDVENLGIRLLLNGITPIIIKETVPINYDLVPRFVAVLVKRPNSKLTGGDFHGQVTLQIVME